MRNFGYLPSGQSWRLIYNAHLDVWQVFIGWNYNSPLRQPVCEGSLSLCQAYIHRNITENQ